MRLAAAVQPGSRRPGIARTDGGLVVAVRERALEGRANAAVVDAVAAWLGIASGRVTIERGTHGRTKRLAVDGLDERAYARALERL